MEENPHLKLIGHLRTSFNKITTKIENEEELYWIHYDVEDLLKRALVVKKMFKHMKVEKEIFDNICELVDTLKQLSHDITDILYIEHKIRF